MHMKSMVGNMEEFFQSNSFTRVTLLQSDSAVFCSNREVWVSLALKAKRGLMGKG